MEPELPPPELSIEEAKKLSDEFNERDDCPEVPADLLELHEVLEWNKS